MATEFHRLDLGITNSYLIKIPNGYIVVDTGYYSDFKKFLNKLKNLGVNISDIEYLFLTHHHDDHAGFATRLTEESGCLRIVHEQAIPPLQDGESVDTMKPVNLRVKMLFSIFSLLHKDFRFPSVSIDESDHIISEKNGRILRDIGLNATILHTPGHCRDSMSIVTDDGRAYVGDAAMNFPNIIGLHHRPIYVEDEQQVYRSWKNLIESGSEQIFPAHGEPFSVEELKIHLN